KDVAAFVAPYDADEPAADLVASGAAGLPFWVARGWRVGDRAHALAVGRRRWRHERAACPGPACDPRRA
ncbi:MAG: hypothetical protein AAFU49_24985, partial [Pseudomonadota bacterium]